MNRRNFLGSTALVGLSSIYPVSSKALPTTTSETADSLFKTLPYLQALLPQSVVVRWITSKPAFSWVEFGDHQQPDQRKQGVNQGLVEANNCIHAIRLNGLRPGKTYYYRICSKVIDITDPYQIKYETPVASDVYSFTTPTEKSDEVSFSVFNDIHDRPESFSELLKFAGDEKKDFVFLNGDMFDYQIDENQLVDHLFKPLGILTATGTPFIFSRGNHETRGQFARQTGQYFTGYGSSQYYFSFQYGPVYFIVLDSGEDKEDSHISYAGLSDFDAYRMEQAQWLKEETTKKTFKKAKYRIVFSHIPLYYSNGPWNYGSRHCRAVWGPILNQAKIDLLISGHTHVHGLHPATAEHAYPIVIGGGPRDGKRTIINIQVDDKSLKLEMLDDLGQVVGNLNV